MLRSQAIELIPRDEGREADWSVVAQALFDAAFTAFDEAGPYDDRAVLRRVEERCYERLARNQHGDLPPALGFTGDPLTVQFQRNLDHGPKPKLR